LSSIIRRIKLRRMRFAGHIVRMGEKRKAYRLLLRNPEGKRSLGRPRHRWVNNISIDLGDVGKCDLDGIGLAQHRDRWRALMKSVFNLGVP
jgi:hypothetical protein